MLLIFDDQRDRLLKTEDCVCLKDATILWTKHCRGLEETRQILGLVDLDHSELPNPEWVPTETLEAAGETEAPVTGRSHRHRSQIILATRPAKSLLQVDVSDFIGRQLPLRDQRLAQHRFIREPVATGQWANLQARR